MTLSDGKPIRVKQYPLRSSYRPIQAMGDTARDQQSLIPEEEQIAFGCEEQLDAAHPREKATTEVRRHHNRCRQKMSRICQRLHAPAPARCQLPDGATGACRMNPEPELISDRRHPDRVRILKIISKTEPLEKFFLCTRASILLVTCDQKN